MKPLPGGKDQLAISGPRSNRPTILLVYRVGCQITLVTNSRRYVQGQCKARCGVFFPRGDPLASDCRQSTHATNLPLDDNLIEEARRAGHHKTKKEAVKAALAEYGLRRKRLRILNVFGSVDFDPKYDYKAERGRKRS
jgi:hypothetical protein